VPSPISVASVYYPSLVVNCQIRFDSKLTIAQPISADELADKTGDTEPSSVPQPLILSKSGKDDMSVVVGLVPVSASVEIPGYRNAGSFELEFLFRDFPIDPRAVRAIGVAIHLDAVPALEWSFGMTGHTSLGRRRSIAQTTVDNLLLAGVVDDIVTEYNDSGSRVKLSGRDLRGILADTSATEKTLKQIDLREPLDKVIKRLVNELHPLGKGIQVEIDPSEWPDKKVPTPYVEGDLTRPNFDAAGPTKQTSKKSSGSKTPSKTKGEAGRINFWDLIVQWCFLCGAVPYFVGSNLRLRPTLNLYDQRRLDKAFDPRFPTPFSGGHPRDLDPPTVKESETFGYRRLVFGRDIASLKFDRKIGGVKVPVIEVSSIDTDNTTKGVKQRWIKAQYPSEEEIEARATTVGPSGEAAETSVLRVAYPGCKNQDQLLRVAKSLHAEIGRQEIGGSCETKNLASFGGSNQDADMLKIRPGDPVEIRMDGSGLGTYPPIISELNQHSARSFEEEVKEVAARLGDENLARVLVSTNRKMITELQQTFRVANVRFTWDSKSGAKVEFDFQNYVEARFTDPDDMPALVSIPPALVSIPPALVPIPPALVPIPE